MLKKAILGIPADRLATLNHYFEFTGAELYNLYGIKDNEVITHTVYFEDGFRADIRIIFCEKDFHPFVDTLLFDKQGKKIDPGYLVDGPLEGVYEFNVPTDEGVITYCAIIQAILNEDIDIGGYNEHSNINKRLSNGLSISSCCRHSS